MSAIGLSITRLDEDVTKGMLFGTKKKLKKTAITILDMTQCTVNNTNQLRKPIRRNNDYEYHQEIQF